MLVNDVKFDCKGNELTLPAFLHSLATELGKGLLIPRGILSTAIMLARNGTLGDGVSVGMLLLYVLNT
jgi:hypothetical protein